MLLKRLHNIDIHVWVSEENKEFVEKLIDDHITSIVQSIKKSLNSKKAIKLREELLSKITVFTFDLLLYYNKEGETTDETGQESTSQATTDNIGQNTTPPTTTTQPSPTASTNNQADIVMLTINATLAVLKSADVA